MDKLINFDKINYNNNKTNDNSNKSKINNSDECIPLIDLIDFAFEENIMMTNAMNNYLPKAVIDSNDQVNIV